MAELMARHSGPGRVAWIGLRPARRAPMRDVAEAALGADGIEGDRGKAGARAVTLVQWEHLAVIAALAGRAEVAPALLRRNVAVAGINLLALKDAPFRLGTALLRGTGPCAPCSRMEEALGPGGYSAVRGHGGITAEVLEPGLVRLGDGVGP